jgi:hypothetical protein
MLTVTDCGCLEHKSCQATFTGNRALMMTRFITNLPMCGKHYTFICEYGHTHRVIANLPKYKIAVTPLGDQNLAQEVFIDNLG